MSLVLPSPAQRDQEGRWDYPNPTAARGWDSPSHLSSSAPHHSQRHLLIFLWLGDFSLRAKNKSEEQEGPGTPEKHLRIKSFFWLALKIPRQALHVSSRISVLMVPRTPYPRGLWLHPIGLPQPLPSLHIQGMENSGYESSNLSFAAKRGNAGEIPVFTQILSVDTEGRQQSRAPNSPHDTQPSSPRAMGCDSGVSQPYPTTPRPTKALT